ncbi:MAG: MarR family winged helix-turn-helix transcriptional regulator [Maritimibacter sp.]
MNPLERFARALSMTTQLYNSRMGILLGKHDLTPAQFGVLNHIARRGAQGQSTAEIARAVEVNQPAVTKMLQKFERLGWITWQGQGRGRRVALSQNGGAALGQIIATLGPDHGAQLAGWTEAEILELTQGLERMAGWYDAHRLD